MSENNPAEAAQFIRDTLRMKTFPVAVSFVKDASRFPDKARRPLQAMGKQITHCQAVTMARSYGWTVALAAEDMVCVPARIVFGFSNSPDPVDSLSGLFCEVSFSRGAPQAEKEVASMHRFEKGEIAGILFAPLQKADFDPDTILFYGNPGQMTRLAQAWSYGTGERVAGCTGGKVECDEYLIAPFKTGAPRMVIPGNGERIFAMTQDDEMVFAISAKNLPGLMQGLKEAGKPIGARYPVTPYQNFQPEFPKNYKELGKSLGMF